MAYIQARTGKDGKTNYRVQVRRKGYPTQTATFTRKTDAKKWGTSTEAAIDERRHRNISQAKRHTVAELIDKYIDVYLPMKPRSARPQKQQLNWWKGQIGTLTLADLTSDVIVEYRNKLSQRKLGNDKLGEDRYLSPASVNRYLAVLSHMLTIGVKELRWLPDSPMRDVSKMPEPKGRVRFLSDDERSSLLEACLSSKTTCLYTVVVLALSTGMRRGEILNLKWADVDTKRGAIVLHDTKNKDRRSVPLVGKAYDLIVELQGKRSNHSDYLFPSTKPNQPTDIKKSWYGALERAKITNFKFHDLRHSAASYLAMNGASLPEIASVLGHKTYEMVKRYAHLSDQHTADVVERMNEKIFGDDPA